MQDSIFPSAVVLPGVRLTYSLNAQLMWLKQEAAELCQVRRSASRARGAEPLCRCVAAAPSARRLLHTLQPPPDSALLLLHLFRMCLALAPGCNNNTGVQ